jgi:hypothetical protein
MNISAGIGFNQERGEARPPIFARTLNSSAHANGANSLRGSGGAGPISVDIDQVWRWRRRLAYFLRKTVCQEAVVLNILIRPIMFLSAAIAAFFVARDAPNFTIIQMVVGLFLTLALVAIGAFWETLSDCFRRKGKTREPL